MTFFAMPLLPSDAKLENDYFRRAGSRVPVLSGGTILEPERQSAVHFSLDLTERRQAEADREAHCVAELANCANSQLCATVSHELRTPLNGNFVRPAFIDPQHCDTEHFISANPSLTTPTGQPPPDVAPASATGAAIQMPVVHPAFRATGVRAKLLGLVTATCITVLTLTAAAIGVWMKSIEEAAQLEARNLALTVAMEASYHEGDLQRYMARLNELYTRDLFIVDTQRITIGGLLPADIGTPYRGDRGNEVGQTLRDGRPRAFIEVSPQHPKGAKQLVVPLRNMAIGGAPIAGGVVLEYTHISAQLYQANVWTLYAIGLAGLAATTIIGLFGARISRRLVGNIQQIHRGMQTFANGDSSTRIAKLDADEVGDLALAFNRMADELQQGQRALASETALAHEAARLAQVLAYTDKLTGLGNRTELSRLMDRLLKAGAANAGRLGVLLIDLDRFKNVNDTLGHASGDGLLKAMGDRFLQVCTDATHVCRMGGDEFVILVPDLASAGTAATLARRLLISAAQPIRLEGHELRVTASIGISMFPSDGDDERTLVKHADIALYQAKNQGRNDYAFYSPALNRHSVERLAFESELFRAVEHRELTLYYQPKIVLASGDLEGVEALLRWEHPTMGFVSPLRFIPVAEETGAIMPLGRWVLEEACRQQMAWQAEGLPSIKMAVNLSARQFADENLVADIRRVLSETGMPAAALELEITESTLAQDETRCIALLHELKALGLQVAVDDFGTGYSSLAKLKEYPIDTLKIDRAFVRDLETNTEDQAITQAIITMGKSLGLSIVAEGVETEAQLAFLNERGCDEIQGYYFSRPVPPDQLAAFARAAHDRSSGTLSGRAGERETLTQSRGEPIPKS